MWQDKEGNIRGQNNEILMIAKDYIIIKNEMDIAGHNEKENLKRKISKDYLFPCL